VKDRYGVVPGTRTFKNKLEIFKIRRPVTEITAGMALRITDPEPFKVM